MKVLEPNEGKERHVLSLFVNMGSNFNRFVSGESIKDRVTDEFNDKLCWTRKDKFETGQYSSHSTELRMLKKSIRKMFYSIAYLLF